MSSILQPQILIFKADAAIAKGKAVKTGAGGDDYIQVCSAATDKSIGITQNAGAAAGDMIEVAVYGGASALVGGTVAVGDLLTSDSSGLLVATTSANDKIIAKAMAGGVVNDIVSTIIVHGNY